MKLPIKFKKQLKNTPETGFGYHIVNITLKDGKRFPNVIVKNCEDIKSVVTIPINDIVLVEKV